MAALLVYSAAALQQARAAAEVRFSGELGGSVTDSAGKPQTGAVVLLFNKQNQLLRRSVTSALGNFAFGDLLPDLYSIQVSLSNFVPAIKERIAVKPGMRSTLAISLSRLFSSIQIISAAPVPGGLMSDDWKWTLRADEAVRPVLHLVPAKQSGASTQHEAAFSGSRGLIRLSAADGGDASSNGEADLGTQFAFATSLYGTNHFQVAGDLGYTPVSGAPSAAIRTAYSRSVMGSDPTVAVTLRQFYVPLRLGQTSEGSADSALPALRTLSVSFANQTQITDNLALDYGIEMDMVSFLDHFQYMSPYARLSRAVGQGSIDFTWTSGNARPELGLAGGADANADLERGLAELSVLPRITIANDHAKVQRGDDYELGVTQRFGSREYRVSAWRENISNASLMVANPQANLFPGDLLPDMFSNSALFDAGHFAADGFAASVTQDLGADYKVTLVYGTPGVFAASSPLLPGNSGQDLRSVLQMTNRDALMLRVSGTVKCTGTRFVTSYEWTDYQSAMPGPLFSTDSVRPEPGFNLAIRQPIPMRAFRGRIEASAELRNLLAQGYLPLITPGGQQLLLVNNPRTFRGGLAFVF